MRRVVLITVLAVTLALLAGCGYEGKTTATPENGATVSTTTETTTSTTTTTPVPAGDAAAGKVVFKTNCGGCHTLADAGTTGTVGPNLDQKKPDAALVLDRVTNGKGAMPAWKGTLTDKQIADVVAYVSTAAGS
jgi:mono/diheme cytochrome c family protein